MNYEDPFDDDPPVGAGAIGCLVVATLVMLVLVLAGMGALLVAGLRLVF